MFCVNHFTLIQSHIDDSKWPLCVSVKCISSAACLSEGDALRELDSMNIVRSDPFVLISGDVVSNLNLKKAIAFHKQKRTDDPNNVMTVVLKPVQERSALKPVLEDLIVSLDSDTSQVLLFDNTLKSGGLCVPLDLLEQQESMIFRTDLIDCNINICSPEFLLQFSDNFDYQVRFDKTTVPGSWHSLFAEHTTRLCAQRSQQLVPGKAHLRSHHGKICKSEGWFSVDGFRTSTLRASQTRAPITL